MVVVSLCGGLLCCGISGSSASGLFWLAGYVRFGVIRLFWSFGFLVLM